MTFYDMTWLERLLFLKRIKGGGSGHEETTTSNTFVTDMVAPLRKLLLSFAPKQSGSGDPSPTNVRPISGWDGVIVTVSPTLDTEAGQTYTTSLGQTVYGGTLDMVSGVLTVTQKLVDLGSLAWSVRNEYFRTAVQSDAKKGANGVLPNAHCSALVVGTPNGFLNTNNSIAVATDGRFNVYSTAWTGWTGAQVREALDGVMFTYELATPQTYQLTPQQINTLIGTNNILTDAEVSEIIYLKKAE